MTWLCCRNFLDTTKLLQMTPNTPLDPVIACAENIALLSLLHSVPTLPASNSIDGFQTPSEGYALSFEE
jgi:hypothetical protein